MGSVTSWILAEYQAPSLGHIVHIGAGLCDDLADYLDAGAKTVTLVEPDPATATMLREKIGTNPQVTLIEAAISSGAQGQLLNRFSFADLNSLRNPTGLTQLFPALEVQSQEPVRVQNPTETIQHLDLSETDDNMLVIEAPGEAMDILQALENAQVLRLFKYLRINEGSKALYQGATPIDKIHMWLERRFFVNNIMWDKSDPDCPTLSLAYDSAGAKQARFESELTEARSALKMANMAAADTNQQLNSFQIESDRNIAQLQQELTTLRTDSESKAKANAAQSTAKIETLQRHLTNLQMEIQSLTNEIESHVAQVATLQQQITTATAERDKSQQEQVPLNAKIKAAEHNLAMSLRIQSLREADLKDLQNRYKDLLGEKDGQSELLERLTASLSNAALYLQDMEGAPTETISPSPKKRKKNAARKTKAATASDE